MTDSTKQIVEALLRAPELVMALREDPKAFAARFGLRDRELLLLQTGKRLISDLVDRFKLQNANHHGFGLATALECCSAPRTGARDSETVLQRPLSASSNVAVVGVTSLAAITGIVAALGVVSVVGINNSRDSDNIP
jgi:hypothetical protein